MKNNTPQTIKIVTVDDSELITERLESMLSDLAHVKYLGNARNVASALKMVVDMGPDVVILDINLDDSEPLNNGITLLSILKKSHLGLKVIMFTNLTGKYYKNRCIELGADYFFDKSNDFERIPDVLFHISNQQIVK